MIRRDFFLFNTPNSISVETDEGGVLDEVLALCRRYESLFSRFSTESQLFRLNHAAGRSCEVDPELARLIETALSYCRESEGRFDITLGSVLRLWDFKRGIVPEAEDVAQALEHVDYRAVSVRGAEVMVGDAAASIDLGGVAKGYIADAVLSFLKDRGVGRALVNLGGNVAVMGGKPDGAPWRIGIRMPQHSRTMPRIEHFATVSMEDGSAVTSGVYERCFERDGAFYHHILDPRTGFPAQTDLLSATVLSSDSIDGDGLSTALIIMGADHALEFACDHPRIELVLVTNEGDVLATPGVGRDIPFEMRNVSAT